MTMTFAELRKQMTPPTPDQVTAAIKEEMVALADEFMPKGFQFFGAKAHYAERLAMAVLMDIQGHNSLLGKLLIAYQAGALAAFPVQMVDDDVKNATEHFMEAAENIAQDWQSTLEGGQ
jgi:hypothetical protein